MIDTVDRYISLATEPPAVETAAPTEPAEVQPEVMAAAEMETEEEVVVELTTQRVRNYPMEAGVVQSFFIRSQVLVWTVFQ